MDRRTFIHVAAIGLLTSQRTTHAQTAGRIYRIGYLATVNPAASGDLQDAFRSALRELGYVEGRNIAVEYRWTDGTVERLPELAVELVRLKVDLIFAWATPAVIASKQATSTIPIVFVGVADPLASGLVANLARPGGNVTGVSNISRDLMGKLVELLVQIVPGITQFAVIRNTGNPSSSLQLKETEAAAGSLGLKVRPVEVRTPADLESAFATITRESIAGVIIFPEPMIIARRQRVAELAIKSRLPTIFGRRENAEAGGLASYGPSLPDQFRTAISYVDKILRGAKAGDLPVEQPKRFELVINLTTAKALGLTIPQSLLLRADEVIQ